MERESRKGKCFVKNNICYIPLQEEGKFAICDVKFLDLVNQFTWHCNYKANKKEHNIQSFSFGEKTTLHQLILNNPEGYVDHENGDVCDNRLINLRIVSNQQNSFNRKMSKNNKSGYKGVCWQKKAKTFHAQICKNGIVTSITRSKDPAECAAAYDIVAGAIFEKYARLNFTYENRPKLSDKCQNDVERTIHFYRTGERIPSPRKGDGRDTDAIFINKNSRELLFNLSQKYSFKKGKFVEQAILEKIQRDYPNDFNLFQEES